MSKFTISCLVCFGMILALGSAARAECIGMTGANSWELADHSTIVIYDFASPVGTISVPWCTVFKFSDICIEGDSLCEGDHLVIDRMKCEVREARALLTSGTGQRPPRSALPLTVKNPPEFNEDEFCDGMSADRLCSAVSADIGLVQCSEQPGSVGPLNDLLQVPDLYERYLQKGKTIKLDRHAQRLLTESSGYRRRSIQDLNSEQRRTVAKLNRLLLESVYPAACPKVRKMSLSCPSRRQP